jgi:hypothetical protein
MLNDTSVFPMALLENAVTRPIAYQGEEVCDLPKRSAADMPFQADSRHIKVIRQIGPISPAGSIGRCNTL